MHSNAFLQGCTVLYYAAIRKENVKVIVCSFDNKRVGLARDYRANNRMNEHTPQVPSQKRPFSREVVLFCVVTFAVPRILLPVEILPTRRFMLPRSHMRPSNFRITKGSRFLSRSPYNSLIVLFNKQPYYRNRKGRRGGMPISLSSHTVTNPRPAVF